MIKGWHFSTPMTLTIVEWRDPADYQVGGWLVWHRNKNNGIWNKHKLPENWEVS